MARALKDFYVVLGVTPDADPRAIEAAYRSLLRHCDEVEGLADDPESGVSELRRDIREAYDVLGDPKRRKEYDELRESTSWWVAAEPEDMFESEEDESPDPQMFLESMLRQFLSSVKSSGQDEIAEISVPFEAAALGGRARLRMPVRLACPMCGGTGEEGGSAYVCPECKGEPDARKTCDRCGGRGWDIMSFCERCEGDGWVSQLGVVSLEIPAGTSDGTLIPVPGFGGEESGPGDRKKYLRVKVSGHPFFSRDGKDICCRVSVSKKSAKSGTIIQVRTIRGRKQKVEVPPETRDGTVLRLVGEGIESEGHKGDQLIEIHIKDRSARKTGGRS